MQRHLSPCASAAHRAVLGLLPVALGRPVPQGLAEDLAASPPGELVAVATFQHVHTLVACAFARAPGLGRSVPEDLPLYFREIQAANARRNRAIAGQLEALGRIASQRGLAAVALKGAAELLSPIYPAAGARLLSDTDILLAPDDLETFRSALLDMGAREDRVPELDRLGHHHLPALQVPGWPAPVELHRQIGRGAAEQILPAADVLARAMEDPAGGLGVPADADRLGHAVLHAQFGRTDRLEEPRIGLRDAADFALLADRLPADALDAVRARFDRAGHAEAFDRFAALSGRLFGTDGARQAAWVDRVLEGFAAPQRDRRRADVNWLRHYATGFLLDPERRRHYLKTLRSWRALRRVAAFHRERRRRFR